jgi:hypothetical protein
MGDNGMILNWLETRGYDGEHFRVACLTRWQGVYTSLSDLVRLIPAYERFLSVRFDQPDECRDVAQRAFQHLATSDIDLRVMRGPVSALQEWFDGNVGEFMDFLQNDKPSLLFQFLAARGESPSLPEDSADAAVSHRGRDPLAR